MAAWVPRAAEGLWGRGDPQTLSLSPHGAFPDLGDVLAWSHGWALWLFMFWGKNSVYTPSLQSCPLHSTVLMCLFGIFFNRFKTAK